MDYVLAPYTIIVDTREQAGYKFTGFRADSRRGYAPLVVPIEMAALKSGDYSLKGFEGRVAVERKSKADAYSTFSQGRERFENELERLATMDFAAVVIEATLQSCLNDPPPHTKFTKKSFYRSYIAWMVRYRLPFIFCPTRTEAERTTLRILERWWLDDRERQKQESQGMEAKSNAEAPPQTFQ